MSKATKPSDLVKFIVDRSNAVGLEYHRSFEMILDDIMASFGKRLKPEQFPDEKQREFLFDAGGMCASIYHANGPFFDLFSQVYMELASRWKCKALGQFFTPSPVSKMMTIMSFDLELFNQKEFVSMHEPCTGAGTMVLAVMERIANQDPELLKRLSVVAIDLDLLCCKMTAVQVMANLFVHGFELGNIEVLRGNTLGNPNDLILYYGAESPEYLKFRKSQGSVHKPEQSNVTSGSVE